MPNFTLRWANRSQSTQDWLISNGDNFTLQPDYVRSVNVVINNNYTYQVAVNTDSSIAAVNLTYTANTGLWSIASATPNEWRLSQGNDIVTLACLLNELVVANAPTYSGTPAKLETV